MKILLIETTDFISKLFEKVFNDQEIYTRSEIHDCLYLVKDLDIELLVIDTGSVDDTFWTELESIDLSGVKVVLLGEDCDRIPVRAVINKPIDVSSLKENLTQIYQSE